MKRFRLLAAIMIMLGAWPLGAQAAPQGLSVPPGWTVDEKEGVLSITADDNSSVLVLSPDRLKPGQSPADFAAAFARASGGSEPAEAADGTLQFDYRNDVGAMAHVIIAGGEGEGIFIVIIVGPDHPDIPRILAGLR